MFLIQQPPGLGQAGRDRHRQLQPLLDRLAQHAGERARVFHQQDPLGQGITGVAEDSALQQCRHEAYARFRVGRDW